ncbi:MAG: hypothetical protein JJE47_13580 [Acidimicrobiia bacterium]|nr:hypothetical protein [Acidimicrobiia bacterium]
MLRPPKAEIVDDHSSVGADDGGITSLLEAGNQLVKWHSVNDRNHLSDLIAVPEERTRNSTLAITTKSTCA